VVPDPVGTGTLQADLDPRTLTGERGVLGGVSLLGSFQHFGLQYHEAPDAIRGTAPDGRAIFASFDEHGRLGNVTV
jgi:hypothetical protein